MREKVFLTARSRLAIWYAGVMGGILCLSGIGSYLVMAHAHWQSLDRELASVAGTFHDILEPNLNVPNQLSDRSKQILPKLCIVDKVCDRSANTQQHILGGVHQDGYYLRLVSLSGKLLATLKPQPADSSLVISTENWQTIVDETGERYHQVSLLLKTAQGQDWGYVQVGRSLNDYDRHLGESKLALLIGVPIALSLISIASWWLSAKAMQPIYRSYQQIQQFTADAAHELRTPLAAIQATTESVLRQDTLSELEAKDTLKTIDRQNQRLSQLVKDLLLLSRMDLHIHQAQKQPCCLNDILNDLLEELAPLAVSEAIALKSSISTTPIQITGNEDQLYRLFANLIANGIRYNHEGGEVTVTLSHKDHYAIIEVQDTGIGIAPEEQEKIFERFYRISSDRSRTTGGSGLGLAIAKAIALSHKGNITVSSESDKGSKFIVLLYDK
ncbi:histidine kinase [Synechococcus sp. PCC 7502]|uniref:two-component system sensor histidine kinase RppB n=1 Tax=Synechococcus sp. PCC 7502 TaxID=1173263 RepID=UPI00029FD58E|nr:two-component system sensor histidine kinase RppB [Synechococcus sp. PCC 7502]AFY73574.1 histidine kinase [Synechococcus sp. PCC 7502]